MVVDQEKLAKLQSAVRTGGKGAPRRKVVKKPKGAVAGGEDPKLQAALKKLAVQPLTGIEEVNMFKADGNVLHIEAPKGTYKYHREKPTLTLSFNSARSCGIQHSCCTRQGTEQGAHGACTWHPEPAWSRVACKPAQAC